MKKGKRKDGSLCTYYQSKVVLMQRQEAHAFKANKQRPINGKGEDWVSRNDKKEGE